MKSLVARTLAMTASLFLAGCLDSPIFNHADAAPSGFNPQLNGNSSCPLEFKKQDFCASLTWTKLPTDEEKGEFTLRFWNKSTGTENGPYVTPVQSVFVKLWMPSMGHGSSPVTVKPAVDQNRVAIPGVFEASEVYFVMPGEWEIWMQLRLDRVVIDQAKVDVQI